MWTEGRPEVKQVSLYRSTKRQNSDDYMTMNVSNQLVTEVEGKMID